MTTQTSYTHLTLTALDDDAAAGGFGKSMEARFARRRWGSSTSA